MGDYTPLYRPAEAIPMTCSADVIGGQPVVVSGSNTVANSAAASAKTVGVAAFDAKSGDRVTVFARGTVHRLVANGAITAGALVENATAGKVTSHTNGTTDINAWAIALTTTSADGDSITVMEI